MTQSRYSICITLDATEMPRCFSMSIQSEVACRLALRALTEPAIWIAPENSSSFAVSVVLPASGWEMMAKVRRRRTCSGMAADMNDPGLNRRLSRRARVARHQRLCRMPGRQGPGLWLPHLRLLNPFLLRTALPPIGAAELGDSWRSLFQQRPQHPRRLFVHREALGQ